MQTEEEERVCNYGVKNVNDILMLGYEVNGYAGMHTSAHNHDLHATQTHAGVYRPACCVQSE